MNKLRIAWLVSMVATMGSLYFSEIRHFIPCEMCWYQRILMYPLTIILGMSVFQKDLNVRKFILPIPLLGFGVGVYHYMMQKTSWFDGASACTGVSCGGQYINWAGFITIPFLSLTAFLVIFILLFTLKNENSK